MRHSSYEMIKIIKNGNIYMEKIVIKDEFIKLGQALKLAGLVDSGLEAKIEIKEGNVKVNGETHFERGKKVYPGDVIEFDDIQIKVEN